MQCDDYQFLLDEFVDGELDSETQVRVAGHIAKCHECSASVETLRKEAALYATYDRELDVSPELWAGVASRIGADAPASSGGSVLSFRRLLRLPQRNQILAAIAASLLLAALAASFAVLRDTGESKHEPVVQSPNVPTPALPPVVEGPRPDSVGAEPTPPNHVAAAPQPRTRVRHEPARRREPKSGESASSPSAPLVAVQSAEREYKRALQVLAKDADATRQGLTPELRASVDKTLASLDRNIEGTRAAAYENPKDPVAAQYMMSAYQQKLDALQDIASLSSRN
jgi:hypothetical protein